MEKSGIRLKRLCAAVLSAAMVLGGTGASFLWVSAAEFSDAETADEQFGNIETAIEEADGEGLNEEIESGDYEEFAEEETAGAEEAESFADPEAETLDLAEEAELFRAPDGGESLFEEESLFDDGEADLLEAGDPTAAEEARWQTKESGEWIQGAFSEAVTQVYDGGTIELIEDVFLKQTITIGKEVTVTSADPSAPNRITCEIPNHPYLLNIAGGDKTVTFRDILLDGGSRENVTAQRAFAAVNNGKLVLGSGAVICNNRNTTPNGSGGGITLISGSVTMEEGAAIRDCSADYGGAVAIVNAGANVFTMKGGSLTGNHASIGGGAVFQAVGTFLMYQGAIEENQVFMDKERTFGGRTPFECGGGIYLENGVFYMENGTISKNQAYTLKETEFSGSDGNQPNSSGGGVFQVSGVFDQAGGSISGNRAANKGGGAYVYTESAAFTVKDAVIAENYALWGGGIFANSSSALILGSSTITGNRAERNGGGILAAPLNEIEISGSIRVKGNYSGETGKENNFRLDDYENEKEPTYHIVAKELSREAEVGLSTYLKPGTGEQLLFVVPAKDSTLSESDLSRFQSDDPDYGLILDNGSVYMIRKQEAVLTNQSFETDYIYDGKNIKEPLKEDFAVNSDGAVSFVWYQDSVNESHRLQSAPKNAGSYILKVYAAETARYKAGECEVYVTIRPCAHEGGTADCHTQAVCEKCGEAYGKFDGASHTGGTEVKNAKAATHTKAGYTGDLYCKGCGKKLQSGKAISMVPYTEADIAANSKALNVNAKLGWSGKNMKIGWSKISEAQGYDVFAAKCGKSMKLVKSVKSSTAFALITRASGAKVKTTGNYKVQVRAYRMINGRKKYIANSLTLHTAGKSSKKYTNASKVKVPKSAYTLRKGKTASLSVKVTKQSGKKKLLTKSHGARVRYWSSNTKVASVSGSGKIKAVGKGSCYVYAAAQNGVKTRVKVKVN